jgi:hypothetical protein
MGKEINSKNAELAYHEFLDRVQADLYEGKGTEIDALLDDEFLYDTLGIRVSCFMVFDSVEERYVLYQNNFLDGSGKFYPRIPFKIKNGENDPIRKYEPIIDLVFIGNRHPRYKYETNPYPEFHDYFQPHTNDLISEKVMHEYWDKKVKPSNEKLEENKSPAFNIFHRKTGEILFFLYAWRYLVRYYSRVDRPGQINSFEEFYFEKSERSDNPLDYEEWFKKTTGFNFWKLLQEKVESNYIIRGASEEDIEYKEYLESVNQHEQIDSAFEEYKQYEFNQPAPFDFISVEWEKLGINPHHERGCNALRSLLEYALLIKSPGNIFDSVTPKDRVFIQEMIHKIIQKKNLGAQDKLQIHHSLSFIFYTFLTDAYKFLFPEADRLPSNIADYFETLQKTIKFPIFPYFLELLFDKNSNSPGDWHRPKEHLVFPIWYSNSNQINKNNSGDNSRYVAYVLLSLEPSWSLNNCFEDYGNETNQKINIHKIKTFFHIISKSLIENGFYLNVIKKMLLVPATKAAISQYMCRNLSHNLGSHSIPQLNMMLNRKIANKDFWRSDRLYQIRGYNEYIQGRMEFLAEFSSKAFSELYVEYSIKNICEKLKQSINLSASDPASGEFEIVFKGMIDSLENKTGNDLQIEIGDVPTGIEIVDIRGDNLGIQALYTIVENVIRNLYKHSKPAKIEEQDTIFFYITISEPKDPVIAKNFYAIDIIDRHGKENLKERKDEIKINSINGEEEVTNPSLDKINKLIRQKILKDSDNTLRDEGWGMLEMKSAAAYLLGLPLDYIDAKYDEHINVNGEIYPYPLTASFHYDAEMQNDKNIGYRFYLPKSKFCLIDTSSKANDAELKEVGIEFGNSRGGRHKFFIGNINSKNQPFVNQRVVNINELPPDIITNLGKENESEFKTIIWKKYLEQFENIKNKDVFYARDNKPKIVTDPKNSIVFNVHAINITYNGINSNVLSKEKLHPKHGEQLFFYYESFPSTCDFSEKIEPTEEPYLSMLKEAAALRVSIFDERMQESSNTDDDQKYDKEAIKASNETRLQWRDILLASGVYIPTIETVNLLKVVKEKNEEEAKALERHLKERVKESDYLIIHFTLLEILFSTTDKKIIGEKLSKFILENEMEKENKALVLISGRGRPSNLPDGHFFANYTTIADCVSKNRSKFRLITILKSLRKLN